MAEKSNQHDANAPFAKLQHANEAKRTTSDYETAAAALRAKTERLKALRLARDAATPAPAPKRKTKKNSKESLSDWLDGQAKEGRNG